MSIYAGGVWFETGSTYIKGKNSSAQRRYFNTNYKYNAPGIGRIEVGTYNLIEDIFNLLSSDSYTTKKLAENLKINEKELKIGLNYFINYEWAAEFGLIRKKWNLTNKGKNFFNTFIKNK